MVLGQVECFEMARAENKVAGGFEGFAFARANGADREERSKRAVSQGERDTVETGGDPKANE